MPDQNKQELINKLKKLKKFLELRKKILENKDFTK